VDALRESLLESLGDGLLECLGDLAGAGGVGLALVAAGVVNGVGEVVLDRLGGVLLDGARN
jgi:hypothetical protein